MHIYTMPYFNLYFQMVDDQDENMPYFFCGTTTGDILCINKATNILTTEFPQKNKFVQGVTAVSFVKMTDKGFNVLIGSGNGIVGNYSISIAFEKGNKVKTLFKHRPDAEWVWEMNYDKAHDLILTLKNAEELWKYILVIEWLRFSIGVCVNSIYLIGSNKLRIY